MECQDILEQAAQEGKNTASPLYHLEHRDGGQTQVIQPQHFHRARQHAAMVFARLDDCLAAYTYYIYRSQKTGLLALCDTPTHISNRTVCRSARPYPVCRLFLHVGVIPKYSENGSHRDLHEI